MRILLVIVITLLVVVVLNSAAKACFVTQPTVYAALGGEF